ncbi:hypothetical protein ACFL6Y_05210 [Elusimicrobiota bacterium]
MRFILLSALICMVCFGRAFGANFFSVREPEDTYFFVSALKAPDLSGKTTQYHTIGTGLHMTGALKEIKNSWMYLVIGKNVLMEDDKFKFERIRTEFYAHELGSKGKVVRTLDMAMSIDLDHELIDKTMFYDENGLMIIRLGREDKKAKKWAPVDNVELIRITEGTKKERIRVLPRKAAILFDEALLMHDIFTLEYPLYSDSLESMVKEHKHPLFKQGIISGKDENRKLLIADLRVRAENIGNPVFIIKTYGFEKKLKCLGIISRPGSQNFRYALVEPMDKVLDLINIAEGK